MCAHQHAGGRLGRSLSWRLAVWLFLPFLACALAMGYLVDRWLDQWLEERMQEEVELIARTLKRPLGYSIERGRGGTVQESLDAAFDFGRVYGAYLYDTDGTLLARSGAFGEARDFRRPHVSLDRNIQPSGGYEEMGGRRVFSFFVPLQDRSGLPIGLLQVSRSEADMAERLLAGKRRVWYFLLGSTFLLGAIILCGYYFGIGRSLKRLAESMARIESGDRAHRADPGGPAEVRALAEAFNRMLDSIDAAVRELEHQRTREQSLRLRLIRSERLAFLGKMAGGLAHEIGTPLSTIDGKAQRGLRKAVTGDELKVLLREIRTEVLRISELVRQLLQFGQDGGRATLREVALGELMTAAVASARRAVSPLDAEIIMHPAPSGLTLLTNRVRSELALKNLIQNAIQVNPGGRIELGCLLRQDVLHLFVDDAGPGLNATERAEVFEPFWRGSGRSPDSGSGLGLALVQQIANELGGRVEVSESAAGGCRFCLILPVNPSPAGENTPVRETLLTCD